MPHILCPAVEWRSSSSVWWGWRFVRHWTIIPGLPGSEESRVCWVQTTYSARKWAPLHAKFSNRYSVIYKTTWFTHSKLSNALMSGLIFCPSLIHRHSPNLHQTAWKHEASLYGGRGPVCRGEASCIPDQWEHSGEPHFENGRGNDVYDKFNSVTGTALIQDFFKIHLLKKKKIY